MCQDRVDALRGQRPLGVLIDLARHVVVVLPCKRLRDVARDGVIPALAQPPDASAHHARVFRRLPLAPLCRRAIVHGGGDDGPSDVGACQTPVEDRGRRGQGQHDRREGGQLVVQVPRLADVTRLESHLQAAAAHPVRHAVHLDGRRRAVGRDRPLPLRGRLRSAVLDARGGVLREERHADVHLAAAAAADIRGQGAEARVRVDAGVRHGRREGGHAARRRRRVDEVAHAHEREIDDRRRNLVRGQGREEPCAPQAHVLLHLHQTGRVAAVRCRRRAL
mmetsp:Transcript_30186/g.93714  ORF Transcript_30186/g.93714 Transcript_30186/m.93714 type:complete len:278 (+) Transcript_30186:1279-2112(+)